jgi:NADPH2:quinone reductase
MKVVEISGFGGPEVLEVVDRPEPVAAPGHVLVRVRAATVNPVDVATRAGAFAAALGSVGFPLVLGWDVAGEVVGGDPAFAPGQRVLGMIPWFVAPVGAYAEVVSVNPAWLASLPKEVDTTIAATLPLNGSTARQALDLLHVRPGQTVLVTGASGGVGGFAVQLAAAAGAHVVAVASTGDEDFVAGLGAKLVLPRAESADALVQAVRTHFPDGVDAVLDAAPIGAGVIGAVRDAGAFVGTIPPAMPETERDITVRRVEARPDAAGLRELVAVAAAGGLTSRIAGTLPLEDAAEAHRRTGSGARGKFVLVP